MEVTRLERQSGDQGLGPGIPTPPSSTLGSLCPPEELVSPAGWVVMPLLATALLPRRSPADVLEGALWLADRGTPWRSTSIRPNVHPLGAGSSLVGAVLSTTGCGATAH